MLGQPGFFEVDERLKRLSDLGDQLLAFAGAVDFEIFRPDLSAALAYADVMTRDIVVPDKVFAEVARHFDERQLVELTVLIGTYNMNARVLQALELDLEPPPSS